MSNYLELCAHIKKGEEEAAFMNSKYTASKFSVTEIANDPKIRRQFLRGLPILQEVEEDVCNDIADTSKHFYRDNNEVIVKQGDPPGHAIVMLRGLMELSHADRSTKPPTVLYYLPYRHAGEPGGLNNLVCHDTHAYTARAVMPTDLLVLNEAVFLDCFKRSPALARNIIYYLKTYFGNSCARMGHIAALQTKQARVVGELLEIAQALQVRVVTHSDDDPNRIAIDWLNRPQWADKIGVSPGHLAKALQQLAADKIKTTGGKEVACKPFIGRETAHGGITIELAQIGRLQKLYHHLLSTNLEEAVAYMVAHNQ